MAIVVQFIRDYAPWVYGACALVALWYLRVAILARRERRYSVFALEREAALNRTYGAWTMAAALLAVMGLVYFTSTVVSDAVEPLVDRDTTPTPPIMAQVVISPTLPLPDPAAAVASTATPEPARPTAQPRPTRPTAPPATEPPPATPTPAVQAPRCADAGTLITSPGVGAAVSGMVPIFGTAVHENFQYYKLEFGAGTNPAVWSYFDGGEQPVQGGQLGALNGGALAPGVYTIRLVVVDQTGNFRSPCQTVVEIR